ncbi:hypothetical protein P3T21_001581 [Paraburkholderia sp. GAS334]
MPVAALCAGPLSFGVRGAAARTRVLAAPSCPRYGSELSVKLVVLNDQWALLRFFEGKLESVLSFETDGERIARILVQRNPDKLARIAAAHGNT